MTWLYIRSEPGLWTVGHYDPAGKWRAESDHDSADKAAARVHWLNGGRPPDPAGDLADAKAGVDAALAAVGLLWQSCPAARTPRLAEAVGLLDRARGKLAKELMGPARRPTGIADA